MVDDQAQWPYDREFREGSQWQASYLIPQSKCDFMEDHPQRTCLPFFLSLGSEFLAFLSSCTNHSPERKYHRKPASEEKDKLRGIEY